MADAPSDNSLFLQTPSVIARTLPVDLLAQKSIAGISSALTGVIPVNNEKAMIPIARFNRVALINSEPTWLLAPSPQADKVLV